MTPTIPLAEYQQRRQKLLKSLNGAAAVVFAGDGSAPLIGKWRVDQSFLYLTGIATEPGAAVLFDPAAENPDRRIILLLKPLDPELERWDGYRGTIVRSLRERLGFKTVMRTLHLPALLTSAARRNRRLACLHPFAVYPAAASPDLAAFRQIAERLPGIAIEDRTQLFPQMRSIKSPAELGLMKRAIAATAAGYAKIVRVIRPGIGEAEVDRILWDTYRAHGAEGLAYNNIVGSGLNGTVLHYMANNAALAEGDLLVIDSGAQFAGYAADVTRTYPVSGRFTDDQRDLYEVVLKAQLASIKALKPGARHHDFDAAARNVIDKAGLGDYFIHGIGHQLGLDVHDVTPDGPFKAGMILTVEPGVYLPDQKVGIRIEDDVLITPRGPKNLTAMIPKTVKEIEAAMAS